MSNLPKELKNKIESLPDKLREVVGGVEVEKHIVDISKKHGLHLDKVASLELETFLVLLGLEPGSDFVDNIRDELGVDFQTANKIAEEIDSTVFEGVRRRLQGRAEEGGKEETQTTSDEFEDAQEKEGGGDRDKILKEIEKPQRVGSAIKSDSNVERETRNERVTPQEVMDVREQENIQKGELGDKKNNAEDAILEKRMGETVLNPHQKQDQEKEKREAIKRKYPEGDDPYREPIN